MTFITKLRRWLAFRLLSKVDKANIACALASMVEFHARYKDQERWAKPLLDDIEKSGGWKPLVRREWKNL